MKDLFHNIDKNEKIAHSKAEITLTIILVINTVVNALTDIWENTEVEITIAKMIIVAIVNIISYSVLYAVIDKIHQFIWMKRFNYDLEGEWYVIQIDNDRPYYLRAGSVTITQKYYQIHMAAKTFNIAYDTKLKKWKKSNTSQATKWTEDLFLEEDGDMSGLYHAERTNLAARIGFHRFTLVHFTEMCQQECLQDEIDKCKKSAGHIEGWLCDVAYGGNHDMRNGRIFLHKSYEKHKKEVSKICEHICEEHPEVLDINGIFSSEIR